MDKYFQNGFFINLEHRKDRLAGVQIELAKVGLSCLERFNAIKMANGAVGCTMSHIKCLQLAKERGWSHVIVVEDDIVFTDASLFLKQFRTFMEASRKWDVIILEATIMDDIHKLMIAVLKLHHVKLPLDIL